MYTQDRIRRLPAAVPSVLLTIALVLTIACGGNDSNGGDTGSPSPGAGSPTGAASPSAEPTAGPTLSPPSTGSPSPEATPTPTEAPQVDVIPVEPFEVRSTEAINVRTIPSTSGDLLTTIFPGETARVTGEAIGEAVEAGDASWYRVEVARDGSTVTGFLYAAYVVRI